MLVDKIAFLHIQGGGVGGVNVVQKYYGREEGQKAPCVEGKFSKEEGNRKERSDEISFSEMIVTEIFIAQWIRN